MTGPSVSFKAVDRISSIFIGRVDKNTNVELIENFVNRIFNIKVLNIEKLEITTDQYNCFKINVNSTDRSLLFDAKKWPKGIVIKKFYTRRGRNNN